MATKKSLTAISMLLITSILSLPTSSHAEVGRFMKVSGTSTAPTGHVEFCKENPSVCTLNGESPVVVKLDETRWNELIELNSAVNARIKPITDREQFGVEEYWTYPTNGAGDCEEYVLEKQRQLLARGWPQSAVLITVVKDQQNAGHAVLVVRTDKGDVILDNQIEAVMPWYSTPYRFVKRQSTKNPKKWAKISDFRVGAVASIQN